MKVKKNNEESMTFQQIEKLRKIMPSKSTDAGYFWWFSFPQQCVFILRLKIPFRFAKLARARNLKGYNFKPHQENVYAK